MIIPLSTVELKKVIRIEKFITNQFVSTLLLEIGIIPNAIYKVKNKLSCGKVIIGNDDFKVALDKRVAEQILVKVSL